MISDAALSPGAFVCLVRYASALPRLAVASWLRPKSPVKKKAAWPPKGRSEDEEEGEAPDDLDDDDDESSRHSNEHDVQLSIDHAKLYD